MPIAEKRRKAGFTLLEAVIGLAIGALSMIAFTSLFKLQNQTVVKNQGQGDFFNLTNQVRELAANTNMCNQMFANLTLIPNLGPSPTPFNLPTGGINVTGLDLNPGNTSHNTYGSVTVTAMQISNVKTPACLGCEDERTFDFTITGTSGNQALAGGSTSYLTTTMSVLAQTEGASSGTPNLFNNCIDVINMQAQQACEAMSMTWTPPNGPCTSTNAVLNYAQMPTIYANVGSPGGYVANPPGVNSNPGLFSMCFVTGIVGGGIEAPEGIQITGSCQQGWTVYIYNFPTAVAHQYDWACIYKTGSYCN
jgi:type II secretory pathway pseudopilin PulG